MQFSLHYHYMFNADIVSPNQLMRCEPILAQPVLDLHWVHLNACNLVLEFRGEKPLETVEKDICLGGGSKKCLLSINVAQKMHQCTQWLKYVLLRFLNSTFLREKNELCHITIIYLINQKNKFKKDVKFIFFVSWLITISFQFIYLGIQIIKLGLLKT